jgi:hypothetical protein
VGALRKIPVFFVLLLSQVALGQIYTTQYNFESFNQNLLINPANPHPYRFVVGFPVASGLSVNYTNTLFKLGDVMNNNEANENIKRIIDNLQDKERLNLYQNADILFAGFGVNRGYISFGIQQELTLNVQVPSELLRYLYYGNNEGGAERSTLSISDFNAEVILQNNYHIGYQHWLLDSTLILGGRFKFISGTAHARFNRFNASIYSDIFEWSIQTDILAEVSGGGYFDDYTQLVTNPLAFFQGGNNGWGLDFGVTYLLPKMKISASVLNIGQINWNQDIRIYQSKGTFTWNGVEINEEDQDVDFDDVFDSLSNTFEFKEIDPYSYRTQLPMQVLASYEFQLHPKHAFAATYQGSVWSGNMYHNAGINYIGRYAKRFSLILGYSRLNGNLNNFGLGFTAALGPVQLFLLTDNAWGVFRITELSATSVRFGLNLVFFDKELKKNRAVEEVDN